MTQHDLEQSLFHNYPLMITSKHIHYHNNNLTLKSDSEMLTHTTSLLIFFDMCRCCIFGVSQCVCFGWFEESAEEEEAEENTNNQCGFVFD